MTQIEVQPEGIGLGAGTIKRAGESWGSDRVALVGAARDVARLFGVDQLGSVLTDVYALVGDGSLTFAEETGFCLVETGVVLDGVAAASTEVEVDNTIRAGAVDVELTKLGTI